mmetsp:Transcript_134751/g.262414  ORF Transcript_134751/g.262414 Transcript_134751/m.262414 type:complete len:382 (+) Transcript_134751:32-1177(+)
MEDVLQCPICLERFDAPRLLPGCGHTFCAHCVQTLPASAGAAGNRACPTCRAPFQLADVRPNFTVQSLLGEFEGRPLPPMPPVMSFYSNDVNPVAPPLTSTHLSGMPDPSQALRTFPQQGTAGSQTPMPIFATQTVILAPSQTRRTMWSTEPAQPQVLAVLPQAGEHLTPRPPQNPGCSTPCWAGTLGGCFAMHLPGAIVGGALGCFANFVWNFPDPDRNCIYLAKADGVIIPLPQDGGPQGTTKVKLWSAGFTAPLTEQGFKLVTSDRRQSEMDKFLHRLVQHLGGVVADRETFVEIFTPRGKGKNTTKTVFLGWFGCKGARQVGGPPFRSLSEAATVLMLKPEDQGVRPLPGRWRFERVQQQLTSGTGFSDDTNEIRIG